MADWSGKLFNARYESVAKRVKKVHISAGSRLFKEITPAVMLKAGGPPVKPLRRMSSSATVGVLGRNLKRLISSSSLSRRSSYTNLDTSPSGDNTSISKSVSSAEEQRSLLNSNSMPMKQLLSLAIQRLGKCPNIQEITIEAIGNDEPISPIFARFVAELFTAIHRRDGTTTPIPVIRTFNVDVDLNNWRTKSSIDSTPFTTLPTSLFYFKSLTSLTISLELSSIAPPISSTTRDYTTCITQLREIVFESRDTLQSLSLLMRKENELYGCDVAEIFPWMSMMSITFPVLRKLEIRAEVYGMNIARSKNVARFLGTCTGNLEELTLLMGKGRPVGEDDPLDNSPSSASGDGTGARRRLVEIWEELLVIGKCMAQLKELKVSLSSVEVDAFVQVLEAGLIPNLRKLVLTPLDGYALPFEVYTRILEAISGKPGSALLEEINVFTQSLSPSHLEILQDRFPRLKKVYLAYGRLCSEPSQRLDEAAGGLVLTWLVWKLINRFAFASPLDVLQGPPSPSFVSGNIPQLFDFDGWKYNRDLLDRCERHKKQRKMLNPAFSSNQIREFMPVFYEVTEKLCIALKKNAVGGSQEVDLLEWMTRTALEVIGQSVMGYSFDNFEAEGVVHPYAQSIKRLPELMSGTFGFFCNQYVFPLATKFNFPRIKRAIVDYMPIARVQEMKQTIDVMHQTSLDIVKAKRDALQATDQKISGATSGKKDIISILMGANEEVRAEDRLTDEEVIGQISTFVFAGQDTTSSTLCRILHQLCLHQDIQSKLRSEIRETQKEDGHLSYDKLSSLPYLDAVCRETFRVYPALYFSSLRTARKDIILPLSKPVTSVHGLPVTEIMVPNGTQIIIPILGCNTSPDIWGHDAHEWKPQRWLSPLPESILKAHIPSIYSHLMTFTGGPRACIGFKYSELAIKVIVSTLISSFKFDLPKDREIIWRRTVIVKPYVDSEPQLPLKITALD
ncbi:hypothetical protein NP233_g11706 [Leucocoprinus birnbaumii]|uniref:Cytochrome P450 n=1 Tax=Leucocoprinus birnbaumii TaxID=56174 RepID=A0AAD5VFW6_9AGAR|nr:hypothetical protein NP233_g11706 [Leucocoprinus birnbaumii]